jgi:hypothetical protein
MLRRIPPSSPYWKRARLLIATDAMRRGAPDGIIEVVRDLITDPTVALDAVRVLATWRLGEGALPHRSRTYDAPSPAYNAHLDRTVAELERIARSDSIAAGSAKFHIELIRLQRTSELVRMVPAIYLERAVIATVCTSGSTPDVAPRVTATVRAARSFVARVLPSDDDDVDADTARLLRSSRDQAATDAGAALVWAALADPELVALSAWHAEAVRELGQARTSKLDAYEREVLSVRVMLLSADVGRAHRNRIHQELSEMEHVGRRLNSAGFDWHTNKPLKFAAGTAGLHVALEYCPGEAAARTMSQPTPPATRAHGCAGCAASGTSPDWLAIGLFVVVWRYRRPRRASKTIAASASTRGPRCTQVRAAPPSG